MTNKQIASLFKLTGALMELHGENPFKTKSYGNAYMSLRKVGDSLLDMSKEELEGIPGVGKAIAEKILDIQTQGTFSLFEELKGKTPPGVVELLTISGLGPKKVELIWKVMGIEDPGSLLYACTENRLVEFKGFGEKSQKMIEEKLHFYFASRGKMLLPDARLYIKDVIERLQEVNSDAYITPGGQILRGEQIVEYPELIWFSDAPLQIPAPWELVKLNDGKTYLSDENGVNSLITKISSSCNANAYVGYLLGGILPESYISSLSLKVTTIDKSDICSIVKNPDLNSFHGRIFNDGFPVKFPEIWHKPELHDKEDELISKKDIKGLVHLHTTYSDGINTLEEMVEAAVLKGFEYIVVTDHSRHAFYARGLEEERLLLQLQEIDQLSKVYNGKIKIVKGIECDILPDGSLDYSESIWKLLDVVIISVHSNLNMDKKKATQRLVSAIENPYSSVLGHPSGRVMLSRNGYDLDYEIVFDACAANNVHIELNASPQRLDLDFNLLEKAQNKGIKISINPDAHSISGIDYIDYGVTAARRGGLLAKNCLNALNFNEFMNALGKRYTF